MKILVLIAFLTYSPVYGQRFSIQEVKIKADKNFYSGKDTSIIYPIIITTDIKINRLINRDIEKTIFRLADENKSLKSKLKEFVKDGMITLNYKVTFRKNGLLSLCIYVEGCGAYCEGHNEYLNYDLRNGKKITTFDLIEKSKLDSFKNLIQKDIRENLVGYKNVELRNLAIEDSSTYFFAVESMDYCINNISFNDFTLTTKGIELVSVCPFPHAIRAYEPGDNYPYEYKFIGVFFKPEFRKRLIR